MKTTYKLLYKDLKLILKRYFSTARNMIFAYRWFNRNIKKLPEHWDLSFQDDSYGYGRLLFIHHSHYDDKKEIAPIVSFVELCKLSEEVGVGLKKEFMEYIGLDAYSKNPVCLKNRKNKIKAGFNLNIRQCQYDKCDVEYVEETKKVPKLIGLCADLIQ